MSNYTIENVHVSDIVPGDTIMHKSFLDTEPKMYTVCANNIKRGGFHGTTIFGDSYRSGTMPVKKVNFIKP